MNIFVLVVVAALGSEIDHEEPYCAFELGHYVTADSNKDLDLGVAIEWGDTKSSEVE
jgi:hypothetical protein